MIVKVLHALMHLPRRLIAGGITLYQQTLSPDHGPLKDLYPFGFCRHEPTCSQYGKEVILKRGVLIGTPLLLWRLLECHPWRKVNESKIKSVLSRK